MNKDEFMRKVTFDYNYSFEQARQLWSIAEDCLGPSLIVGGSTGAVMGAAAGTVTLGTMTLPGWAVGFLGGFIAGEMACVAGGAKVKQAFDELLKSAR
jgi:hypothetical protein